MEHLTYISKYYHIHSLLKSIEMLLLGLILDDSPNYSPNFSSFKDEWLFFLLTNPCMWLQNLVFSWTLIRRVINFTYLAHEKSASQTFCYYNSKRSLEFNFERKLDVSMLAYRQKACFCSYPCVKSRQFHPSIFQRVVCGWPEVLGTRFRHQVAIFTWSSVRSAPFIRLVLINWRWQKNYLRAPSKAWLTHTKVTQQRNQMSTQKKRGLSSID